MKSWKWFMMGVVTLCGLSLHTSSALAQAPLSASFRNVTVAFGAGLNTEQAANHVVIPRRFRVKQGGVVHFMVAGFHQIVVCPRGIQPREITVPEPTEQFINDPDCDVYIGQSPITPEAGYSNDRNRVESVSFARPGNYLVICNVRSHFLEGMYATVQVRE
jgi:plastocyanin